MKQAKDRTTLSDSNRAEDPGYLVRLVGQVVPVSVQTVALVKRLAQVALEARQRYKQSPSNKALLGHYAWRIVTHL